MTEVLAEPTAARDLARPCDRDDQVAIWTVQRFCACIESVCDGCRQSDDVNARSGLMETGELLVHCGMCAAIRLVTSVDEIFPIVIRF